MDLKRQTIVLSSFGGDKFKNQGVSRPHDPSEVHRGESALIASLFPVIAGLGKMQLKEILYYTTENFSTKVEVTENNAIIQ